MELLGLLAETLRGNHDQSPGLAVGRAPDDVFPPAAVAGAAQIPDRMTDHTMTPPSTLHHSGRSTPAPGSYKWELLVLLWCAFFLHQGDRQIFNNLASLIMDDLGLTKVQFGLVGTIFTVVYGVMVPLSGYAGDAGRRKWVVLGSLLVFSTATLLTGLCAGLLTLILFRSIATGAARRFTTRRPTR